MLNANWAIVSDMTLYIVIPPRRGVATATQILVDIASVRKSSTVAKLNSLNVQVSHMFGDAFSPYLIGALSDSFKPLITSSPALDPYGSAVTLRQSTMMDRIFTYELTPQEYDREFRALEYSLFSCCFFQVRPFFPLRESENTTDL